jgi:hypothetical protein
MDFSDPARLNAKFFCDLPERSVYRAPFCSVGFNRVYNRDRDQEASVLVGRSPALRYWKLSAVGGFQVFAKKSNFRIKPIKRALFYGITVHFDQCVLGDIAFAPDFMTLTFVRFIFDFKPRNASVPQKDAIVRRTMQ